MKILIINGSHRDGNTDIAIKQLISQFPPNHEIRVLLLRDMAMRLPDGCETCGHSGICPNIHDEFSERVEPTIRNYDAYIIATPTWDDGVTPLTKIFWDRIVSWSADERSYLKNKKLAVLTHGQAGLDSWNNVINWVKSICIWEHCRFADYLAFKSGAKVGDIELDEDDISEFIRKIA